MHAIKVSSNVSDSWPVIGTYVRTHARHSRILTSNDVFNQTTIHMKWFSTEAYNYSWVIISLCSVRIMQSYKITASQRGRINMTFIWSRKIKHITADQIKTVLRFWFNATRCSELMTSTKVIFYEVTWRHCYVALRKETEGLEKMNFTKECIVIAAIS